MKYANIFFSSACKSYRLRVNFIMPVTSKTLFEYLYFYVQFSFKLRNFVIKNLFHSRNPWKLKRKFYFVLTTIPVNDVMKVIDCFCTENALLSLHSVMISWPSNRRTSVTSASLKVMTTLCCNVLFLIVPSLRKYPRPGESRRGEKDYASSIIILRYREIVRIRCVNASGILRFRL